MAAQTTGRMPGAARCLMVLSALLLAVLYFTPLWSVRLVAPQYPEGLGMDIRVNTVTGLKEHDLGNINALNHYIGMKAIEPDAIPELTYMPWILGALIAGAAGVATLGRRRLAAAWLVLFALTGAAGLYDFWRWEYDYGHNLDREKAVIVIEGMDYQPPLIGRRQLANFIAVSYPAAGGMLGGIAFICAAGAVLLSYRRVRRSPVVAGAALAAAACAPAMPAIAFNATHCVECRMLVGDRRFGALLVTETGKQLVFDSVDCLLSYEREHPEQPVRAMWVVDAGSPGALVPASEAAFVEEGSLHPPMGRLVSYRYADNETGIRGKLLTWEQVRERRGASATPSEAAAPEIDVR